MHRRIEDLKMFRSFFFNDTAATEIYTLSLHDALPISDPARLDPDTDVEVTERHLRHVFDAQLRLRPEIQPCAHVYRSCRSEEHTSELQSRQYLVCRLLLEKHNPLDLNKHFAVLSRR